MYPEPSGSECRSSEGRAEPVAERMRSTKSRPGAAPPEAILCNDAYLHGHIQALALVSPYSKWQALCANSAIHKKQGLIT